MNNFGNNFWGQNPAFAYAQRPKLPNPTNPLTPEQIQMLKQKNPAFSLAVSKIDSAKAVCTHRDKNGDTLMRNADGTVTCSICGTTFTPVEANEETVKQIFEAAINCLETIKVMYLDIPDEVTTGYFQMIPFLEKAPQLFKIANDHYSRYNNTSLLANTYGQGGSAVNLYNAMMNPMGMVMPQQMPYGQPGMAAPQQQNVPDVTMGASMVNPFDATATATVDNKTVVDNKQYSL